ncbi:MAG: DUF5522 domain-containing protein [Acidobacteriota bacterium]
MSSTPEEKNAEPGEGEEAKVPWHQIHFEAQAAGDDTYIDPATGYQVYTEGFHRRRGSCCGSGCRHCPYDHVNVPPERRAWLS